MLETYVIKRDLNKARFWKKKAPLLTWLDIELTERCNNNCVHCYINQPESDIASKSKELSTAELKNILKEAAFLECMTIRFTGGEPLLREDFEELYIFARRLGLKMLIFTNATLITPHLAELFSRIPPLEKIEITVYGMRKDSYEAATGVSGSFEKAWGGINLLLQKDISFFVKNALLPFNKNEIDEFESWAKTIPGIDTEPPYSIFFDLRSRQNDSKNNLIKKVRATSEEGLNFLTRRKDRYIYGMKKLCAKFIGPPGDKLFSCGLGHGSGCVDPYGNFQLCMLLEHPDTIYNLKKGSLKDALTNFFPKIKQMKATNPAYLSRCARCFLKGLCEQCPAKSWRENGTLDTPVEYLCKVAHAQAKFLGLVGKKEKAWEVNDWRERIKKLAYSK